MGTYKVQKEQFPPEEGVFWSDASQKWVVRMANKTQSKSTKPFSSVFQNSDKGVAELKYEELTGKTVEANT